MKMRRSDISVLLQKGNAKDLVFSEDMTEQQFYQHIELLDTTLDRIIESGIGKLDIPNRLIREAYKDVLKIGHEQLKHLQYPDDIRKARKIANSLYAVCLGQ